MESSHSPQHHMGEDAGNDWPTPPRGESPDAFMARLRAISGRHPGSGGRLDDSRESIYAGCGE